MPKPTEADKARFRSFVPDDPRVEVKPMFGNLGAFVNGNMFMGLFGSDIGLRLEPAELAELLAVEGGGPFGPPERPMGGWACLPASMPGSEREAWVARALAQVGARPPKTPKQ